ncbi:MAG: Uma2 family endonuclease [Candidatus Xenobia bacterium]
MSLAEQRLSPQEYLELERKASTRSEYYNGRMYAMAGGSEAHNLIVGNVVRELGNAFKGRPCKVYPSDMRAKAVVTGLYTYPDVSALCQPARFEDESRDTLLNPALIVEVLSESTEAYDRGEKFEHYRRIESVTDYVLIAQDRVHVEHFVRQGSGQWLLTEWSELQAFLKLPNLECQLLLSDIYDRVELPQAGSQLPGHP